MDVNLRDFRQSMADVINRVAYGDERTVLTRHGKGVVAIVSMSDLRLLEHAEDAYWVGEALEVEADMKRKGQKPIPHEQVVREFSASRRRKAG